MCRLIISMNQNVVWRWIMLLRLQRSLKESPAVWNSWFRKRFCSSVSWTKFSLLLSLTNNLLTGPFDSEFFYLNSHAFPCFNVLRPIPNGEKLQFRPLGFIRFDSCSYQQGKTMVSKKLKDWISLLFKNFYR